MPLGRERSPLRRLSRPGMGHTTARRSAAVRDAHPRGLPGRPLMDHDPEKARELPARLRRFRPGAHCPLRRSKNRSAARRSRHHSQPVQDRKRHRLRPVLPRADGGARRLFRFPVAGRGRSPDCQLSAHARRGAGRDARSARPLKGAQRARVQVLRPNHHLCLHAGDRHGRRPSDELLPTHARAVAGAPAGPRLRSRNALSPGSPRSSSPSAGAAAPPSKSRAWRRPALAALNQKLNQGFGIGISIWVEANARGAAAFLRPFARGPVCCSCHRRSCSSSSIVLGQSLPSRRESERSASSRPSVWQRGQ
jgi:hypothetical protein